MAPEASSSFTVNSGVVRVVPAARALPVSRGGAGFDPVAFRPQGRHVLREEDQLAAGQPLGGNWLTLRVLHHVALGFLGQGHQVRARPGGGVEDIQLGRHRRRRSGRAAARALTILARSARDWRVGVQRVGLLVFPLGLDEVEVRLADAVVGAPGVFAVERDVLPGLAEFGGGEAGRVEQGPERLGLGQAVRGMAVQGGLPGGGGDAVLPVGREIAAEGGDLVGVALLELVEHLGSWWR